MTLNIMDTEAFGRAMEFALRVGATDRLSERLSFLAGYAGGEGVCELYANRAPHSFEFLMHRADGSRWFNGGLIYSGPGVPADGTGPAFSVSLSVESGHSWGVHS
ncbi:hypothetical protein PWR05_35285 [Paraburkholderia sp. A2RI-6]|uniref:hypothetical protein n=1 Tax=Paraburkholderia sp. A2RI-6 TaxID=3028371 RepID=UPI003B7A3267